MTRRLLLTLSARLLLLVLGLTRGLAAVSPAEWAVEQSLVLPEVKPTRFHLPAEVVGRCGLGLRDLRLLGADGAELPFLVLVPATRGLSEIPTGLRISLAGEETLITFAVDGPLRYEGFVLETAGQDYVVEASTEVSLDGETWTTQSTGVPLFRVGTVEESFLSLPKAAVRQVRVRLGAPRSGTLAITGVRLQRPFPRRPGQVEASAISYSKDEYEGKTVLSVTLPHEHATLDSVEVECSAATFSRSVVLSQTRLGGEGLETEEFATGTLYRLRLPGSLAEDNRENLRIPVAATLRGRQFQLTINNGDSPGLNVTGLRVWQRLPELVVVPTAPGPLRVLTGNPDAAAPRYDLAAFAASWNDLPVTSVTWGTPVPNPLYRRADPLAGQSLESVALDVSRWTHEREVKLERSGNQVLTLDPALLAVARTDFADIRLLRDGRQVPFLLEATRLQAPLPVRLEPPIQVDGGARTQWKVVGFPEGLVAGQLIVEAATPYLQRHLTVLLVTRNRRGDDERHVVSTLLWTKALGSADQRAVLPLQGHRLHGELWLEVENGDNPPLVLSSARLTHAVTRLRFRSDDSRSLVAVYGHPQASAPRYDLQVLGASLLERDSQTAVWGEPRPKVTPSRDPWFRSPVTRAVFWGALVLVVAGLLYTVAKLLPKPPPTP